MTTEQLIYNTAAKDGMPSTLASLLVDQSQWETGNYQHRFFTVGNNAFGYSYNPDSKWQLDKGGPNADNGVPIAQYASVENSVHEITDWIKRRQKDGKFPADLTMITAPDQYAQLLKSAGYYQAEESIYSNGLAAYFYSAVKNFKEVITNNPGKTFLAIAGLVLIGGAVVIYINRKKVA